MLRNQTIKELEEIEELQKLINSREWANDGLGLLVRGAIDIILSAGYTEAEAYEYLEIS